MTTVDPDFEALYEEACEDVAHYRELAERLYDHQARLEQLGIRQEFSVTIHFDEFRPEWLTGYPKFASREQAQTWLKNATNKPEDWEIVSRYISDWERLDAEA